MWRMPLSPATRKQLNRLQRLDVYELSLHDRITNGLTSKFKEQKKKSLAQLLWLRRLGYSIYNTKKAY